MGRRSWLAVTLAASLALAACQDAGEPLASPTTAAPVVTATPTPTPSVPSPPVLPEAAKAPTQAGAEAFYRHFWNVYTWSFATGVAEPLLVLSEPDCNFCNKSAAAVRRNGARGITIRGGEISLPVAVASAGDSAKGILIASIYDQTAAEELDATGKVLSRTDAVKGVRLDARLRFIQGAWHISGIAKGEG